MQLTKFKHACFTLTKNNQTVVVDPGVFSTDFVVPENVVAVIITHEHADHLDLAHLQAIADKNPDVTIVAHNLITTQLGKFKIRAVTAGDSITIGGFSLDFYGGEHAVIHSSIPVIANLGVMIDGKVYYPGDSFIVPNKPVEVLALPACAPWMKISEALDFLIAVRPNIAFPTHDSLLSGNGKTIFNRLFTMTAKKEGVTFKVLEQPLNI